MKFAHNKGFTLIELLVVISIISLLSGMVFAALTSARKKGRDSARLQTARQISLALEQYEQSNNTYRISNAGLAANNGSGFVAKGIGDAGYTNSILATLKNAGYMSSKTLNDPIYGLDNYYLGVCTSTNAYNVFVKLEQPQYNSSTSTISNACGGVEAAALGFSFIASTAGGTSGGGGSTGGLAGAYEYGMGLGGGGGNGGGASVGSFGPIGVSDIAFDLNNKAIYQVLRLPDDKMIVIGGFVSLNGTSINRIAKINSSAVIDGSFDVGDGFNNTPVSLALQPDGKILVGGYFTNYNNSGTGPTVRINTDGTLDDSFYTSHRANNIRLQADGKILINDRAQKQIIRLTNNGVDDGTDDYSFSPPTISGYGYFNNFAIQPDGKIIAVGYFNNFGGTSRNYIIRVNTDGSIDESFDIGTGPDGEVFDVVIQSTGKIVITGYFNNYNGNSSNYIARLNSDGSFDNSYNIGTGLSYAAEVLTVYDDNKIVAISPNLYAYNGSSINGYVRLNEDGTIDNTFDFGTVNNLIRAFTILSTGKIALFTEQGG